MLGGDKFETEDLIYIYSIFISFPLSSNVSPLHLYSLPLFISPNLERANVLAYSDNDNATSRKPVRASGACKNLLELLGHAKTISLKTSA